jgi:chromosome segregation ATPase
VREFWLRLATDFELVERCKDLRDTLSDLEQRMRVSDDKYSRLLLEVESKGDQVEQCMDHLTSKTQEIERLKMALRDADDEKERERERQQGLIARLRASVRPRSRLRRDTY